MQGTWTLVTDKVREKIRRLVSIERRLVGKRPRNLNCVETHNCLDRNQSLFSVLVSHMEETDHGRTYTHLIGTEWMLFDHRQGREVLVLDR